MFLVDNVQTDVNVNKAKKAPKEKEKSPEGEFEQMLTSLMENENTDTQKQTVSKNTDDKIIGKNNTKGNKETFFTEIQFKPRKSKILEELANLRSKYEKTVNKTINNAIAEGDTKKLDNKKIPLTKNQNRHSAYMQQKIDVTKDFSKINAKVNDQVDEVTTQEKNIKHNSLRQIVSLAENTKSPDDAKLKAIKVQPSYGEGVQTTEKSMEHGHPIKRVEFQEFLKSRNDSREIKSNVQNNIQQNLNQKEIISNINSETSRINSSKHIPNWNIAEQIVQKTRAFVSEGRTFMEIQLKPEFLGKVKVNLTYHEGVVTASLTAEKGQTGQILNSAMNQVRAMMQEQGVRVDYLGVDVGGQSDGQNNEGTNSHKGKQSGNLVWFDDRMISEMPVNEEELAQRYYSGEVNYLA